MDVHDSDLHVGADMVQNAPALYRADVHLKP